LRVIAALISAAAAAAASEPANIPHLLREELFE
jgi:hypothetical protein